MSIEFNTGNKDGEVYLIDGNAYVYRAYYAVKGLINSKGQATNAVFGFVRMLIKFLKNKNPRFLAVVFDAKGSTFRHEKYKKYKANRRPMPDDLEKQFSWIKKIVVGFGIPIFEKIGFEADDLIGTLARLVAGLGLKVVVVTGDKDMIQLITEECVLWDPVKDIVLDFASVRSKFGVDPQQMVDVMGFSGDKSDNIPGVPGIGLKRALEIIRKFGSMEKCYEEIDSYSGKKLKDNLLEFKEQAFLSRELVTINVYVPIELKIEELHLLEPNKELLFSVFNKLEFKQFISDFGELSFSAQNFSAQKSYHMVFKMEKLDNLVVRLRQCKRFVLKVESDSANPMVASLIGISISMKKNEVFYIPVGHEYSNVPSQLSIKTVIEALKPILIDQDIKKVGHNIKKDSIILLRNGVEVSGVVFDTMLASYLIDSSNKVHNLDRISIDFLGKKKIKYNEIIEKEEGEIFLKQVPLEDAVKYVCETTDAILSLEEVLAPILKNNGLMDIMLKVEIPLISILIGMEMKGVRINKIFLRKISSYLDQQLVLLETEIYNISGRSFNINSPKQLSYVMFEKLKLPVQRKTKNKKVYSTDGRVLKKLATHHKLPKLIIQYRKLSKLRSTYIDSLLLLVDSHTCRVHTSFNQTNTSTGRLSSSNPNLQSIPIRTTIGSEIRKAFIATDGHYLLSADYSQIELRILAHCSKDEHLIDLFKKDEDVHVRTASEVFQVALEDVDKNMRRQAKIVNFGIIYGMGAYSLANELSVGNRTAQNYIDNYFKRHKGVKNFIDENLKLVSKTKCTRTLLGRKRFINNIRSSNQFLRRLAERAALNTVIQGTAADLMKLALISVNSSLIQSKLESIIILSVHDEIILEVPFVEIDQVVDIMRKEMESVFNLLVPLKVNISYGENWSEAH